MTTRSEQAPTIITNRILASGQGSVFAAADFYDLGEKEAVRKALLRMVEGGILSRPMRGLFLYPEFSKVLNKNLAARPEKVAEALARNFNWTISPYGETALNQLGLSTQVPAVYQYVSDGPNKTYEYDNFKISFKHRANRETTRLSPMTLLVIHALKALGKNNLDETIIKQLSSQLSNNDKEQLCRETQHSSAWIHDVAMSLE